MVPLEFAAILPRGEEFHCFFHQDYVKIRLSELDRIRDFVKRSEGKERLSEPGFVNRFMDFLDKYKYPKHLFTLSGKMMQQVTFPVMLRLLGDHVRWSFTQLDPCAIISCQHDEFVPTWGDICDNYDVPIPQDALTEARLVRRVLKDHL